VNKDDELTFPPSHNAGTVPPGKLVGTRMQRSPPVLRQIRISRTYHWQAASYCRDILNVDVSWF